MGRKRERTVRGAPSDDTVGAVKVEKLTDRDRDRDGNEDGGVGLWRGRRRGVGNGVRVCVRA